MAFKHIHLARYTVTQHGQYARTLAQYVAREGRYATREDLVAPAETQHLPPWAEGNATRYFVQAAKWERTNGQYALMLTLSLPRELTDAQRTAALQDCVTALAPRHVALWAQHAPLASDGQPNPHGHVLLSPRLVDGVERSAAETFRRWQAEQPTVGGQRKDPFWKDRQAIGAVRLAYTDVLNVHLEWAGSATRVDPRAFGGHGRTASLPIWHAEYTPPSQETRGERQAQAAQWWESRKAVLGIGNVIDLSRDQWTSQVYTRSRTLTPGTALPRTTQAQRDAYERRQVEGLTAERRTLRAHQRLVEAQLRSLAQRRPRERTIGGGYQARLAEQEQTRERDGYGYG